MRPHLLRRVLGSLDLQTDADRGLVVPSAGQECLAHRDGVAPDQLLRHGAVAHGIAPTEVPDGALTLDYDRDRIRIVRVLWLGDEERGESDVLIAPQGFAADLPEEVLTMRRADDGDVPVAEELDPSRDGVPYFRVVQFAIGAQPSALYRTRPRRRSPRWPR